MTNEQNIDFVLRSVEERDIRFVRLWFTDVLGNLKSFAISPEDLEEAFEEGIGCDGSAVDGFAALEEADMLAFPDASTFQVLPWRPSESGVARIFCNIRTPQGDPFPGDPRACLYRAFRAADQAGYVLNVSPELEFFYFKEDTTVSRGSAVPVPLDNAGYFDLTPDDSARDLRRDLTLELEQMSIPVEYSYHAAAPSQNGVSLRYSEAVTCADNIMTARLVIKQTARQHGMFASFMPKPLSGVAGSAMFLSQSLFDHNGNNLFWAEGKGSVHHLSVTAQHYVAGILK
ncbi:glutamine synthetase family protein, partial [Parolsenella catena]|uniref:glutamine synthetase family protein n=1 Tax=Parolsenella catena TaxID=2003188 RepID=UPI003077D700